MKRIDADSVRLHSVNHYIKSMTVKENYGPFGNGIVERVLIENGIWQNSDGDFFGHAESPVFNRYVILED